MSYKHVKDWRRNAKIRLYMCFGKKCGICGVEDDPVIYDFHHMETDKKEFVIASKIRSWENLTTEAKKCAMLCAPCHRKLHAGIIYLPETLIKFNADLIDKKITHDVCPICTNEKPISQVTCSRSCARKSMRGKEFDWSKLPELLEKYGNPYKVSKVINVSDVTIGRHMKRMGLTKIF